jgi:diguanylate cyclase (GGDEF)-like protein
LAVLAFDLRGFEATDEAGGSAEGGALRAAALAIRAELRVSDHLGRVSGAEFVAVLPCTALAEAQQIALRIVETLGALKVPGACSSPLSVSVGWASASEDHLPLTSLIRTADDRLHTHRVPRDQLVLTTAAS